MAALFFALVVSFLFGAAISAIVFGRKSVALDQSDRFNEGVEFALEKRELFPFFDKELAAWRFCDLQEVRSRSGGSWSYLVDGVFSYELNVEELRVVHSYFKGNNRRNVDIESIIAAVLAQRALNRVTMVEGDVLKFYAPIRTNNVVTGYKLVARQEGGGIVEVKKSNPVGNDKFLTIKAAAQTQFAKVSAQPAKPQPQVADEEVPGWIE